MSRQTRIKVEDVYTTKDVEERKQKINEIFLQILRNSELQKIA